MFESHYIQMMCFLQGSVDDVKTEWYYRWMFGNLPKATCITKTKSYNNTIITSLTTVWILYFHVAACQIEDTLNQDSEVKVKII